MDEHEISPLEKAIPDLSVQHSEAFGLRSVALPIEFLAVSRAANLARIVTSKDLTLHHKNSYNDMIATLPGMTDKSMTRRVEWLQRSESRPSKMLKTAVQAAIAASVAMERNANPGERTIDDRLRDLGAGRAVDLDRCTPDVPIPPQHLLELPADFVNQVAGLGRANLGQQDDIWIPCIRKNAKQTKAVRTAEALERDPDGGPVRFKWRFYAHCFTKGVEIECSSGPSTPYMSRAVAAPIWATWSRCIEADFCVRTRARGEYVTLFTRTIELGQASESLASGGGAPRPRDQDVLVGRVSVMTGSQLDWMTPCMRSGHPLRMSSREWTDYSDLRTDLAPAKWEALQRELGDADRVENLAVQCSEPVRAAAFKPYMAFNALAEKPVLADIEAAGRPARLPLPLPPSAKYADSSDVGGWFESAGGKRIGLTYFDIATNVQFISQQVMRSLLKHGDPMLYQSTYACFPKGTELVTGQRVYMFMAEVSLEAVGDINAKGGNGQLRWIKASRDRDRAELLQAVLRWTGRLHVMTDENARDPGTNWAHVDFDPKNNAWVRAAAARRAPLRPEVRRLLEMLEAELHSLQRRRDEFEGKFASVDTGRMDDMLQNMLQRAAERDSAEPGAPELAPVGEAAEMDELRAEERRAQAAVSDALRESARSADHAYDAGAEEAEDDEDYDDGAGEEGAEEESESESEEPDEDSSSSSGSESSGSDEDYSDGDESGSESASSSLSDSGPDSGSEASAPDASGSDEEGAPARKRRRGAAPAATRAAPARRQRGGAAKRAPAPKRAAAPAAASRGAQTRALPVVRRPPGTAASFLGVISRTKALKRRAAAAAAGARRKAAASVRSAAQKPKMDWVSLYRPSRGYCTNRQTKHMQDAVPQRASVPAADTAMRKNWRTPQLDAYLRVTQGAVARALHQTPVMMTCVQHFKHELALPAHVWFAALGVTNADEMMHMVLAQEPDDGLRAAMIERLRRNFVPNVGVIPDNQPRRRWFDEPSETQRDALCIIGRLFLAESEAATDDECIEAGRRYLRARFFPNVSFRGRADDLVAQFPDLAVPALPRWKTEDPESMTVQDVLDAVQYYERTLFDLPLEWARQWKLRMFASHLAGLYRVNIGAQEPQNMRACESLRIHAPGRSLGDCFRHVLKYVMPSQWDKLMDVSKSSNEINSFLFKDPSVLTDSSRTAVAVGELSAILADQSRPREERRRLRTEVQAGFERTVVKYTVNMPSPTQLTQKAQNEASKLLVMFETNNMRKQNEMAVKVLAGYSGSHKDEMSAKNDSFGFFGAKSQHIKKREAAHSNLFMSRHMTPDVVDSREPTDSDFRQLIDTIEASGALLSGGAAGLPPPTSMQLGVHYVDVRINDNPVGVTDRPHSLREFVFARLKRNPDCSDVMLTMAALFNEKTNVLNFDISGRRPMKPYLVLDALGRVSLPLEMARVWARDPGATLPLYDTTSPEREPLQKQMRDLVVAGTVEYVMIGSLRNYTLYPTPYDARIPEFRRRAAEIRARYAAGTPAGAPVFEIALLHSSLDRAFAMVHERLCMTLSELAVPHPSHAPEVRAIMGQKKMQHSRTALPNAYSPLGSMTDPFERNETLVYPEEPIGGCEIAACQDHPVPASVDCTVIHSGEVCQNQDDAGAASASMGRALAVFYTPLSPPYPVTRGVKAACAHLQRVLASRMHTLDSSAASAPSSRAAGTHTMERTKRTNAKLAAHDLSERDMGKLALGDKQAQSAYLELIGAARAGLATEIALALPSSDDPFPPVFLTPASMASVAALGPRGHELRRLLAEQLQVNPARGVVPPGTRLLAGHATMRAIQVSEHDVFSGEFIEHMLTPFTGQQFDDEGRVTNEFNAWREERVRFFLQMVRERRVYVHRTPLELHNGVVESWDLLPAQSGPAEERGASLQMLLVGMVTQLIPPESRKFTNPVLDKNVVSQVLQPLVNAPFLIADGLVPTNFINATSVITRANVARPLNMNSCMLAITQPDARSRHTLMPFTAEPDLGYACDQPSADARADCSGYDADGPLPDAPVSRLYRREEDWEASDMLFNPAYTRLVYGGARVLADEAVAALFGRLEGGAPAALLDAAQAERALSSDLRALRPITAATADYRAALLAALSPEASATSGGVRAFLLAYPRDAAGPLAAWTRRFSREVEAAQAHAHSLAAEQGAPWRGRSRYEWRRAAAHRARMRSLGVEPAPRDAPDAWTLLRDFATARRDIVRAWNSCVELVLNMPALDCRAAEPPGAAAAARAMRREVERLGRFFVADVREDEPLADWCERCALAAEGAWWPAVARHEVRWAAVEARWAAAPGGAAAGADDLLEAVGPPVADAIARNLRLFAGGERENAALCEADALRCLVADYEERLFCELEKRAFTGLDASFRSSLCAAAAAAWGRAVRRAWASASTDADASRPLALESLAGALAGPGWHAVAALGCAELDLSLAVRTDAQRLSPAERVAMRSGVTGEAVRSRVTVGFQPQELLEDPARRCAKIARSEMVDHATMQAKHTAHGGGSQLGTQEKEALLAHGPAEAIHSTCYDGTDKLPFYYCAGPGCQERATYVFASVQKEGPDGQVVYETTRKPLCRICESADHLKLVAAPYKIHTFDHVMANYGAVQDLATDD